MEALILKKDMLCTTERFQVYVYAGKSSLESSFTIFDKWKEHRTFFQISIYWDFELRVVRIFIFILRRSI